MIISLVVAMSKNRVIGVKNRLPWRIKSDMEHFKVLTTGHPVIMGSKTYESIPAKQRPLKRRTNIVLTRDRSKKYPNVESVSTLSEALRLAEKKPGGKEIMIIGGAQVFTLVLPLAERVYLTEIDAEVDGDTYFSGLDLTRWKKTKLGSFERSKRNEFSGTYYLYERTNKYPIVTPQNGRNKEYARQLNKILKSGLCPFCPNGETLKEQEIIRADKLWFLKENAYPLANTLWHFVLTPVRHVETVDELNTSEIQGLLKMRQWLKKTYSFTGDAMYVRSGEPLVTGATVSHLHWHIIVPISQTNVSFGQFENS